MNRLAAVSLLTLLSAEVALGQGTTYLSNLGEPGFTSERVSSGLWFGAFFHTGTNPEGYELDSVQLLMNPASGTPAGFELSIHTYSDGLPGSSLASLSGPDPTTGGTLSYAAAGLMLLPSTSYFVVAAATSPSAEGYYNWSRSMTTDFTSSDGWSSGLGYHFYSGSSWHVDRSTPLQFSIIATAIPEPSSLALPLCGGALVVAFRWRLRRDV